MVNFNPGEFRGFHGRWMLGGEKHPHLRHRKGGLLGAVEHAAGGIEKDTAKTERDAIRAERTANAEIRRTAEATARARGISSSMMRDAERQAGVGRGAEKEAAKEEHKATRSAERKRSALSEYRRLRYGRGGRGRYGYHRGLGAGILRGAALARLLRGSKKTTAKTTVHVPGVPTAKKAAKPKKKAAAKKKAVAKPRTIKPPKAPTGKRTTTGRGKGAAQKVTPSTQVMSNLAGYVNAPGGKRAGIGVAGRTSVSSTGQTAGSRVGGAGRLVVGKR